jgi:asparagine synthase (glutamine-hydrolysing)
MCGLTGWLRSLSDSSASLPLLRSMADQLRHRGPDDSGEWLDAATGVALGFRRLSIIDTSAAGHQPMVSPTGRYVIAFNGEVYNFQRLHAELGSPQLHGHSDTMVLLAAIERWGLRGALGKFIGMFGFALWDREERCLHLVRDRLGVKPMHYAVLKDGILFGSELKAFRAHPAFEARIDRGAVALYARHNYIPAPLTIFENVYKLPPGTILTIRRPNEIPKPEPYWSAREEAIRGAKNPFRGSDSDAIAELNALLDDSVALRQIADVPVGVFLSGGVDSPTVASIMAAQATSPVKTFTIGSDDPRTDESQAAAALAKHLGTNHIALHATGADAMAVIPKLAKIYDEPFGDSSAIPTYLVSRLAREHVTVALSGDGGDELFGGYPRYLLGRRVWSAAAHLPTSARRGIGHAIRGATGNSAWHALESRVKTLHDARVQSRAGKLARALLSDDPDGLYLETLAQWRDVVRDAPPLYDPFRRDLRAPLASAAERAMFLDLITYLPDDLLAKVDRASMAVSLESREPLLDHRVVELSFRLPLHMKIRNGEGKWILRRVMEKYVPPGLLPRRKMGFSIPMDVWLRGPLREWAEELLDARALAEEGFFDGESIRAHWRQHLDGAHDWQNHLWTILMFEAWWREWQSAEPAACESPAAAGSAR